MLRSSKVVGRIMSAMPRMTPAVSVPMRNMSSEYKFNHPPVPEDGIHRPPRATVSSYNKPLPELYHEWIWDATHPEPFFDRHDERLPPPRTCLKSTAAYLIGFFTLFGFVPLMMDTEDNYAVFYARDSTPVVGGSSPNVDERTTVVLL